MLEIGKVYIAPWTVKTSNGPIEDKEPILILKLIDFLTKSDQYYYKILKSNNITSVMVVSGVACREHWKKLKC